MHKKNQKHPKPCQSKCILRKSPQHSFDINELTAIDTSSSASSSGPGCTSGAVARPIRAWAPAFDATSKQQDAEGPGPGAKARPRPKRL